MLNFIKNDFITVDVLRRWQLQTKSPYLIEYLSRLLKDPSDNIFVVSSNSDAMKLLYVILEQMSQSFDSKDLWSNSIDPFGYVVGAALAAHESDDEDLESYEHKEKFRQKEKSTSNSIGYFHQGLLRIAFNDHRYLNKLFENKESKSFDVISDCKMFGLEVKSKWNTTKGNSRKDLYKDLEDAQGLNDNGERYFVEVIDKPGQNISKNKNGVTISNKSYNINLCNGSYIYQVAAKRLNKSDGDKAFKNIVESFPAMLWIFSKYYLDILHIKQLDELKRNLLNINQEISMLTSNPDVKLTDAVQELVGLMRIFLNDYLPTCPSGISNEMCDTFSKIKSKRPPDKLKESRNLLVLCIESLDTAQNLYSLCYELEHGITKAFRDDKNISFFVDKLVGHLFN